MRLFLAVPLSPSVREALCTAQADLRRQGRGSFPPAEEPAPDPGLSGGDLRSGRRPGGAGRRLLPSLLPGGGRPPWPLRRPVVGRCPGRCRPGGPGPGPPIPPPGPGLLPGGPPLSAPHHPGPPLAGRDSPGDCPPGQNGGPPNLPPALRPDRRQTHLHRTGSPGSALKTAGT